MVVSDSPRTLFGYLEEVASGSPTPGGGSVAAIVGALAAALGEMVVTLSLGRGGDADVEERLQEAGIRLTVVRDTLADSAAEDERAYARYRAATALPRGNETEKQLRRDAIQNALREATRAPLAVAQAAAETAKTLETVGACGNPHLRSDAALAALLAEVALHGALLNVRGNAAMMRDKALAAVYLTDADRLEKAGREAAARAYRLATGEAAEGEIR